MTPRARQIYYSLGIVALGLTGRAIIDKVLALHGGAEAVALWGQTTSMIDLLAGVAMNGLGMGIAVVVAQTGRPEQRLAVLTCGMTIGLMLSAAFLMLLWLFPQLLTGLAGGALAETVLLLAGITGCLSIISGSVNSYWLGGQQQGWMLSLAGLGVLASLAAIVWPGADQFLMVRLLLAQSTVAIIILAGLLLYIWHHWGEQRRQPWPWRILLRFLPAGVSIGLMSPLSTLFMRLVLADALSWQDVGMIQAQWRVTDWVAAISGGIMSTYFLPALSHAIHTRADFLRMIRTMALVTLLPGLVVFVGFMASRQPIMTLFYQEGFAMPWQAALAFLLGDWMRISAWIFLHGLFALHRTWAISIGEFLSLPLFALLLWSLPRLLSLPMSLTVAGGCWLASYVVYALFNSWMMLRRWPQQSV
ncbi:MAG: hypothetical protein HQL58_11245 [Magnetococcales bacterium]|nr:hypothetical protein [Magnetococcales bacterium]